MPELNFLVDPDEHGVVNGIELASNLMRSAADALLPYVGHCPACLSVAFKKVADELFDEISGSLREGYEEALMLTPGLSGVARQKAIAAHLLQMRDNVIGNPYLCVIEACQHNP